MDTKRADAQNIEKADLGERAYRTLYEEIIRCNILPGQAITELQMCDQYHLSRSPARRALALLAHDGLITPIPRFGFKVSEISLATVRQIFDMRAALEGVAARASMGRVDLRRIRALNEKWIKSANTGADDMLQVHNQIHETIYAACNNPILEKVLVNLLHQSNRIAYFVPKVGGEGYSADDVDVAEHEELAAALASGDADKAAALAHDHVKGSEQRAIDAIINSRGFSDLAIRIGDEDTTRE